MSEGKIMVTQADNLVERSVEPVVIQKPFPLLRGDALRILSLLRPRDVIGCRLVRKGRDFDGGYVMLDRDLANSPTYSLGIANDVSWDLEMADLGCDIFQYDHTISRLPAEHPRFHWSQIGIAETSDNAGMFRTIEELVQSNGHQERRDLILKMDIEGAEWRVLEMLPEAVLDRFSQILMEMHRFINIDESDHRQRLMSVLEKLNRTHQLIHLHANNWGWLGMFDGVLLPDTFEVTYVRRYDHQFEQCRKVFPTELDMPCNPNAGDIFLGAIGML